MQAGSGVNPAMWRKRERESEREKKIGNRETMSWKENTEKTTGSKGREAEGDSYSVFRVVKMVLFLENSAPFSSSMRCSFSGASPIARDASIHKQLVGTALTKVSYHKQATSWVSRFR